MKLTWITILAIALLPQSVSAEGEAKYPANLSSNPASGQTQVTTNLSKEPDNGTPDGNRTPGGTRTPQLSEACKQTNQPLTALVPENGKGLTTAEFPIFWFYIPDVPADVDSLEFSLHPRSEDEKTTLYRTSVQLSKTPGVIGISVPPSPQYSLKLNESYHWRFTVTCVQKETSSEPIILELDGWVTRVQQSPKLWYDELTNLAKRYLSEPQNTEVKKDWIELLKSVNLEGLAQEALVISNSNLENN